MLRHCLESDNDAADVTSGARSSLHTVCQAGNWKDPAVCRLYIMRRKDDVGGSRVTIT